MRQPPDLFTPERRRQIADLILREGRVTLAYLRTHFGVSEVTLRKDLDALVAVGKVQRTHGGAIALTRDGVEHDFLRREAQQMTEKARIGALAATLVQDGMTIGLDASTTALAFARHLKERQGLTVVTTGLRIALELAGSPGVTVLMPGGKMRPEALSLVGDWGADLLKHVHISQAFVGAQGLSEAEGLTDVNAEEVAMKRALVNGAREVVALIDHTKWGRVALATFCPFARITTIITDHPAPEELAAVAARSGNALMLAR